jgi:hypothetical protein
MNLSSIEYKNITFLIAISVLLVIGLCVLSYYIKKRKNPTLTLTQFLTLDTIELKVLLVCMTSGIVFGFIDSYGLWIGLDSMEPLFSKKLGIPKGSNTAAGYSNMYSASVGTLIGTFLGIIVADITEVDLAKTPFWVETIGIIIGGYLGIKLGQMLSGKL